MEEASTTSGLGKVIYLDHAATTPCAPSVVTAMLPFFSDLYGNPANESHSYGQVARRAVESARAEVAAMLGADSGQVVFTSGATETNNLVLWGLVLGQNLIANRRDHGRRRILVSAIEHRSVLQPARLLAGDGLVVDEIPVDAGGIVRLDELERLLDEDVLLVALQGANNEVGTIQPVAQAARLAHDVGALIHCDAAQLVGKLPVDVKELCVDFLALTAHKMYGPKGVGALYVRSGAESSPLRPILAGGGQECGVRSGTSNVPGIVGFGSAAVLSKESLVTEPDRLEALRARFERDLLDLDPRVRINSANSPRLPGIASVTVKGADGKALIESMPGLALARGSACSTTAASASHVLTALGLSRADALATLRFSLGAGTNAAMLDDVTQMVAAALAPSRLGPRVSSR